MATERDDRIYLHDMAKLVSRRANTVRKWASQGLLPDHLMPGREGGRETMYWREDQVLGVQEFARAREARRGWGYLHGRRQGESA